MSSNTPSRPTCVSVRPWAEANWRGVTGAATRTAVYSSEGCGPSMMRGSPTRADTPAWAVVGTCAKNSRASGMRRSSRRRVLHSASRWAGSHAPIRGAVPYTNGWGTPVSSVAQNESTPPAPPLIMRGSPGPSRHGNHPDGLRGYGSRGMPGPLRSGTDVAVRVPCLRRPGFAWRPPNSSMVPCVTGSSPLPSLEGAAGDGGGV
jgi:hypothetical protein